jgi:hypothetical protein
MLLLPLLVVVVVVMMIDLSEMRKVQRNSEGK